MGDEEEPACKVQYLDGEKEYLELGYIKRPGKCRVNYLNGDSFVGSYNKFQKRTGEGAYTWVKDGEEEDEEGNVKKVVAQKYVGEYANGDKHGLGLMTYPNGDTYQGVFNKNRRHGDGTYTYAGTGDKYSGSWVDDKRQGWGVYVYAATGVQQVGEWSGGKCVNGKWLLPGGSSFHGRFGAGGKPAKGVYYFKGGNQQAGAFDSVLEDPEGDPEDPDAPRLNKWAGGAVLKASVEYAALRRPQADGTAADREALLVLEALEEAFVKFQANVRRLFYNAEVEALEPVMCKELQGRLAAEENADLMAMAEAAGRPRDYVLEAVGDSDGRTGAAAKLQHLLREGLAR